MRISARRSRGALSDLQRAHGVDRNPGPACGSGHSIRCCSHGTSLDENKRLWVQTEAIKAQTRAHGICHDDDPPRRCGWRSFSTGCSSCISQPGHGNWQDHLDTSTARALPKLAPASSLYHVFLALTEVLRVRDGILSLA